jgi:hypothetical protein
MAATCRTITHGYREDFRMVQKVIKESENMYFERVQWVHLAKRASASQLGP